MSNPGSSRVLVIEDDENIMELVAFNIRDEGYDVVGVPSGEEGLEAMRDGDFDLVILDLMLPGIGGLEVCRRVKSDVMTRGTPVIIVSARGEESDIVTGLEMGADDYVTKPFSPKVLAARVKANLRANGSGSPPADEDGELRVGELTIHEGRHQVTRGGAPLTLTATEFRILQLLARRRGWVFTRSQIVTEVHGDDYPVTDRSVDVIIASIRKKLGDARDLVETVRGVGYRFRD